MSVVHENVIILKHSTENTQTILGSRASSKVTLLQLGLPTPDAFLITSSCFHTFLEHKNGNNHFKTILQNCRPLSPDDVVSSSQAIQKLILNQEFEKKLADEISQTYQKVLRSHWAHLTISPTPANKAPVYFPLPVIKGESAFLDFLRQIWSAQYSPHALSLFLNTTSPKIMSPSPVIVSLFEPATASGTITTIDPSTANKNLIQIKAIWGTNPQSDPRLIPSDEYIVSKNTNLIVSKKLTTQEKSIAIDRFGHYKYTSISTKQNQSPKITPAQIEAMVKSATIVQDHYLKPQIINWLTVDKKLYFTRSSDIAFIESKPHLKIENNQITSNTCIAKGLSASPGIATAPLVRLNSSTSSLTGRIILIKEATPHLIKKAKHAAGLIIETGILTSELSMAARETGIPVLVGTGSIHLADNQIITLDTIKGEVRQNKTLPSNRQLHTQSTPVSTLTQKNIQNNTATKIYLNGNTSVQIPQKIAVQSDGVGYFNGGDIFTSFKAHPKFIIKKQPNELKAKLIQSLRDISGQFGDRPIFYYPYDLDSSTAKSLAHGTTYETTIEQNSLIGYRGAARIITDSLIFKTELECILEARNKHNCKNISIIIPMVRSVDEFLEVKKIIASVKLHQAPSFSIYADISTPAGATLVPKLRQEGLDGIWINLDHLTALLMGYDPYNEEVSHHLDSNQAAVIHYLKEFSNIAEPLHVPIIVASQQLEQRHELVEKVIGAGINGLSVSNHRFESIKSWVQSAESKITTSSNNKDKVI